MEISIPRQMINPQDLQAAIDIDIAAHTDFMIRFHKELPSLLSQIDEQTQRLSIATKYLYKIDPALAGSARFEKSANVVKKAAIKAACKLNRLFAKIWNKPFYLEQKKIFQECKDSLNKLREKLTEQFALKNDLETKIAERCQLANTMDKLDLRVPLVVHPAKPLAAAKTGNCWEYFKKLIN